MAPQLRVFLKKITVKFPHSEAILQDSTFIAHEGDKIALVGANGSGKSTMLKLMAKEITPQKGAVEVHGKAVYLPQVHFDLPKEKELYEFMSTFTDNWWEVLEYAQNKFGLKDLSPNRTIGSLSGGELMKVYLSQFLMKQPEILLLDEPTNHIDILSLEVLISTLKEFPGTVICASHDTFFINQFANRVVEIDNRTLTAYGGNYDFYIAQRLVMDNAHERQVFALRQKDTRLRKALKIEDKRAKRSIDVGISLQNDRSTARIQKGYFKEKAMKSTARITNSLESKKERIFEKIKGMEKYVPKKVSFLFAQRNAPHDLLFSIKDGTLTVDGHVLLTNISMTIKRGERIALLGRNGAGKTLLMKAIMGIEADRIQLSGEIAVGENMAEYIGQDFGKIVSLYKDSEQDLTEVLTGKKEDVYKNLVGNLGLSTLDVFREVESFSGGELTKLLLLDLSNKPLDMMVLDEPTNHLDIMAQNALVQSLKQYQGTLLVTSHKLGFLATLALKSAYVIVDGSVVPFVADLSSEDDIYRKLIEKI
jgi:ATPase subunit of ABC transporter with duplicated ATPase domains